MGFARNIIVALGLGAAAAFAGACSAQSPRPPGATNGRGGAGGGVVPDSTGSVGIHLTVAGGEHLSRVNYTLGNGTNSLGGSYDIGASSTLSFVIGSVPAGIGYGLTLTATTDDRTSTCSFPAPGDPIAFDIVVLNRTTTVVSANLQCLDNQGLDSGTVSLQAVASNCAVWNTIVANPVNVTLDGGSNVNDGGTAGSTGFFGGGVNVPATVQAGQDVVLVGSATAPDPASLTFAWMASGGTLSSTNGSTDPNGGGTGSATNQTVFTCPAAAGTYTVTLVVADGPLPDGGGCDPKFTTGSVTVSCVSGGCASGAGCGDAGGSDAGASDDAAGDAGGSDAGASDDAAGDAGGSDAGASDDAAAGGDAGPD